MKKEFGIIIGAGNPDVIKIIAEHKAVEVVERHDPFAPEPIPYRNTHVPVVAVIDTVAMDGKAKRRERRKAERKSKKK